MKDRILIVDAIATNRIVLKIKFTSCFYAVLQATCIGDALDMARTHRPDLILTAATLPDGDAAALARHLAIHPATAEIPIMALADNIDAQQRRVMLDRGVRDVLAASPASPLLLARVRSLIRAHHARNDWLGDDASVRSWGLAEHAEAFTPAAHIRIVGEDRVTVQAYARDLRRALPDKVSIATREDALDLAPGDSAPDVYVLLVGGDIATCLHQLSLISSIRTNVSTRHRGIIVLQDGNRADLGAQALDLGADDLMQNGFDPMELRGRLAWVLRQVRAAERLRRHVDSELREAMFDPLTGLPNRRHALAELTRLAASHAHFAVMVADIDHFKRINDLFGHAAGDAVLADAARRLRAHLGSADMVARLGGEEFVIALPQTSAPLATRTAERLCKVFRDAPFLLPAGAGTVKMTVSIGICMSDTLPPNTLPPPSLSRDARAGLLIDQADRALYRAKGRGRNCVRLMRNAA